jgi:pimeloyl-ACP methyl ester carboxylesterase
MHWDERGDADAPALLLVHGLSAWAHQFDPITERLVPRWHCLAPDLPGFGRSAPLADHSFDLGEIADLVAHELQARGVERVRVVGHSMGAALCVTLAERHPDLVERLVLLAPAGLVHWRVGRDRSPALRQIARRLAPRAGSALMASAAVRGRTLSRLAVDPRSMKVSDARMLLAGARMGDQRTLDAARQSLAGAAIAERVTSLSMPIELIWGEQDRLVPISWAARLSKLRPDLALTRVPGAGHVLTLEAPDAVASAIEHSPWQT